MAGLPKKYAKMGFKKGWKAYRAKKKSSSRKRASSARTRSKKTMAKKKTRRRTRRSSQWTPVLGAAAYGMGREWTLGRLDPLLEKVPVAGPYLDEAAMFGLSYLLAKGKIPVVKKLKFTKAVGKAGMLIEAYRVGAQLAPAVTQTVNAAIQR